MLCMLELVTYVCVPDNTYLLTITVINTVVLKVHNDVVTFILTLAPLSFSTCNIEVAPCRWDECGVIVSKAPVIYSLYNSL